MDEFHVTLATVHRKTLWGAPGARREGRWRVLRALGDRLVLFAFVDDHVHLVIVEDPRRIGVTAGGIRRSLQCTSGPMQPAHVKPVRGRRHLENLVTYLMDQPRKHGLRGHLALSADTCLGDLLGVQRTPGFSAARLWELLPRWRTHDLLRRLDLRDPGQASLDDVRSLPIAELVRITADAFVTDLRGKHTPAVLGRQVVLRLGVASGARKADLALAMGISRQSATDLAKVDPGADAVDVVLRRIALERAVHAADRRSR